MHSRCLLLFARLLIISVTLADWSVISSQLFDKDLKVGKSGLCDILSRLEKDAQERQGQHGVGLKNLLKRERTESNRPSSIQKLITTDYGEGLPAFDTVQAWICKCQVVHDKAVDRGEKVVLDEIDKCIASLSDLRQSCRGDSLEGEEMEVESSCLSQRQERRRFNLLDESGLLLTTLESCRAQAHGNACTATRFLKENHNWQKLHCLLTLGLEVEEVRDSIEKEHKEVASRRTSLDASTSRKSSAVMDRQCPALSKKAVELSKQAVVSASVLQQALAMTSGDVHITSNMWLVEDMLPKKKRKPGRPPKSRNRGGHPADDTGPGEDACLVLQSPAKFLHCCCRLMMSPSFSF